LGGVRKNTSISTVSPATGGQHLADDVTLVALELIPQTP
jgi:hypothetical protein